MEMDDFLQLLTAQIGNQDPLEPMKDTEFMSQMGTLPHLSRCSTPLMDLANLLTLMMIWFLKHTLVGMS